MYSYRLLSATQQKKTSASLYAAQSERFLLQVYGITLPTITTSSKTIIDSVSKSILSKFHPIILEDNIPISIGADGNCMFRAVSYGLFGTQDHHEHLRLLTAIEIICNRTFYDVKHKKYVDLVQDVRIVCDMYSEIVKSVCTFGAYQQMLHLYALSAAVEKPIRSYCPPTSKNELMSEPFSRKVYGRQVKKTKSVEITLMWTMTNIPKCNTDFLPNHFVILKSKDCDDSLNIDSEDEFPSLPTPSPKCSTPTNISNVSQNLQSDSLDNKTCDSPAYCSDISGIELVGPPSTGPGWRPW